MRGIPAGVVVLFCLLGAVDASGKGSSCPYKKETFDKEKRLHGRILCFEDSAMKRNTGYVTYDHGVISGLTVVINPDTKKKTYEANHKNNNVEGVERTYEYATGAPSGVREYHGGKLHGIYQEFRDGKMFLSTRYENDKEVGPAERFNLETGLRESLEYLKPNLAPYRTRIEFFETGDVKSIAFYKDNEHSEVMTINYKVNGRPDKTVCRTPGYKYTLEECLKVHKLPMNKVEALVKGKGKS